MTSEAVLIRLAAIIVLGIAAQWLGWRLRVPAILMLLAIGIFAGPGSDWLAANGWLFSGRFLDPTLLFGDLLLPAVSLSVAIILFEGGLTLNISELSEAGGVIWKLVSLGALVTWFVSTLAAKWIVGLSWPIAILLGAILVVTGPTVIGPLLRHVRPVGQVGPILKWEGIIIDPIGAMLAVIVFEVILAEQLSFTAVLLTIFKTLLVGCAAGLIATALLVLLLRRRWAPDYLHNPLTLMAVIGAFTVANLLEHESGLFAVTLMGIALTNQRYVQVHHIIEFKENLTVLLLAGLFIVLGARLRIEQIAALDWSVLGFIAVLIFIARPVAVAVSAIGSTLSWRERIFLATIAPRGIVAAAVSSVFALRLLENDFPGGTTLVPITFAVIVVSVTVYGLGGSWTAHWLRVAPPGQQGYLIVGANPVARLIAGAIQKEGFQVLLVDTNRSHIQTARLSGLPVMYGSIISPYILDRLELSAIGNLLALTPNDEVNSLAVVQYTRHFGRASVFQLAPESDRSQRTQKISNELRGRVLFDERATYTMLSEMVEHGATVKATRLSAEFGFADFKERYADKAIPLMLLDEAGNLSVVTTEKKPTPKAGQTLLTIVPAENRTPQEPTAEEVVQS